MGIQGGINIKTKINEALKTLRVTYKNQVSCDTEIDNELKVIKGTLYTSGSTQKHILSTGYSHFNNRHEVSDCAERAIIDTIKNFDTTLIK